MNTATMSRTGSFFTDVQTLRERARDQMREGALTGTYEADRETVINILNAALATELVCVLRYKSHYFMATGIDAETVAGEFLAHANEELAHADMIANRITQLGGKPDFAPDRLQVKSHSEFVERDTLKEMIEENLVAERIAIDSYREIINYLGSNDTTTRRMMEEILAVEEEHADDMTKLLDSF